MSNELIPTVAHDERAAFECDWLRRHYPLPMNTRLRDDGRYGDHIIQGQLEAWCAGRAALAATPALPATDPWDGKLSDQLQRAINDLHIECKPAVVRHVEFAVRSELQALSTSYATVKRMYAAARERLEEIDAAQPDPFATPATEDSSAGDLAHDTLRCAVGNCTFNGEVARHAAGCRQSMQPAHAAVQAEPVAWRWVSLNGKPAGTHCFPMPGPSDGAIRLAAAAINPCAVQYLHDHTAPQAEPAFQQRVQPWMMGCFGAEIAADRIERNHRFLEEALELVQATGCTQSEAHQLVDYVFGRPVGEPAQEVGGVMVTLAALCLANGLDMHQAGETELARVWTKVEAIRAKQAAKPKHSPLPQAQPAVALDAAFEAVRKRFCKLPRYSFLLDGKGNVRRVPSFTGNWVEFEAAHTLFDPQSVDAAMAAAQEGDAA